MNRIILTLNLDPAAADVASVKRQLVLADHEFDDAFGVVELSPQRRLYAILLDEPVADRVADNPVVRGRFSNPRVEAAG